MDAITTYHRFKELVEQMPALEDGSPTPAVLRWLAKADALFAATKSHDLEFLRDQSVTYKASSINRLQWQQSARDIQFIVFRALEFAEMEAPPSAHGSFIAAGNLVDALTEFGRVMETAESSVVICDPYMDAKVLTSIATFAGTEVPIRLLTDPAYVKPTLLPMAQAWAQTYGNSRPLELRHSSPRGLHDRAIFVNGCEVWLLSQSVNAFAARSPATVQRAAEDIRELKMQAYDAIWASATLVPLA